MCSTDESGKLLYHTGSSAQGSGLGDDLEGWDRGRVGGGFKTEGLCVYVQLIHFVVRQKLIQQCKASVFQLFKRLKKKKQ